MTRQRGTALALTVVAVTFAVTGAGAEIVQKGSLRLSVAAALHPNRLPRIGTRPVAVSIGSRLSTTDQSVPPPLRALRIDLNRQGTMDTEGLPVCRVSQIQPASTDRALKACRPTLVGSGSFSVDVVLGGNESYETTGRLLVFNGQDDGRPALLGQIYSARPFANSFVIPFHVRKLPRGTYGLELSATLPSRFTSWGHITALRLRLARQYRYRGSRHSFISAGCPAPAGVSRAPFALARVSFAFAHGKTLSERLISTCRASR